MRIGIVDLVRYTLTVALLYGVYCETGVCTALFGLIVAVNIEVEQLIKKIKAKDRI